MLKDDVSLEQHFDNMLKIIDSYICKLKSNAHLAIDIQNWQNAMEKLVRIDKYVVRFNKDKSFLFSLKNQLIESGIMQKNIQKFPDEAIYAADKTLLLDGKKSAARKNIGDWKKVSFDFTYRKVKAFSFFGEIYKVNDMITVLIWLCEWLYECDKNKFTKMMRSDFFNGYLTDSGKNKSYKKMDNADIFVYVKMNNNKKTEIMSKMLEWYGISENVMSFLVDEPENNLYYPNTLNKNIFSENDKNIVSVCEKLVLYRPYLMATITFDSIIGKNFTYNENIANSTMKKPHRLSNGLWVDAQMKENENQTAIKLVKNYCKII